MSTPNPVPAPTPTPAPASPSLLQSIESKLAALGAKLKTDESNVVSWVKTNWPHFVTWAAGVYAALKAHIL